MSAPARRRTITYREAMREAIRDALRARRARLPDGRGRRPLRRLLRASARACSRSSAPSASATRRCRSRRSSAPGIGAALGGMRPIVEIMTVNFSLLALDQIVNNAATLPHMSGGQFSVPARDPHDDRRRSPARRAALAQPRGLVRAHPGPARPRAGDARGRARHALRRRSRIPTRCSSSSTASLYNVEGELAGRRRRRSTSTARRSAAPGTRRHAHRLRRHAAEGARRRPTTLAARRHRGRGDRPARAAAARRRRRSSSR